MISAALAAAAHYLQEITVQLEGASGQGSGVVWSAGGLIVTNAHVARPPTMQVTFRDGSKRVGRIIGRASTADLALIQVEGSGLIPAQPRTAGQLRVGELVLAMGSPLGQRGALTTGIIQGIDPQWVKADVSLAPGNSGGALADAAGQVVGINTMIVSGLALAIPVAVVMDFVQRARTLAGQYAR